MVATATAENMEGSLVSEQLLVQLQITQKK